MPTVTDAAQLIRAGRLSAEELMVSCLDAIERDNPALNAFVYLDADNARDVLPDLPHFANFVVVNGKLYVGTNSSLVTYGLY